MWVGVGVGVMPFFAVSVPSSALFYKVLCAEGTELSATDKYSVHFLKNLEGADGAAAMDILAPRVRRRSAVPTARDNWLL